MTSEEIKQSVTMTDVLSRYGLKPNRAGMLCCPFHGEKHPSMKIYKDGYNCFACGANGDVFSFVMQYESVPFNTAFLLLGGTYSDKRGKSKKQIRQHTRDVKLGTDRSKEDDSEIQMAQKSVALYESGMSNFKQGSPEWCMCQIELAKEKSKLEYLLAKKAGENNS